MPKRGRRPWPDNARRQKATGVQAHTLGSSPRRIVSISHGIPQGDADGKIDPSWLGAPGTHASTHEDGGVDEINVTGLTGLLADPQTPRLHKTDHENGGADEINVGGLSGTLADPQTPSAHNTSHENGGVDEVNVAGLSGLLADPQTPSTHDIITAHNGFPGGGTTFLRDDGTFAAPPGGGSPHALLDGTENNDTVANAPTRGAVIVGNTTPKWDRLPIGAIGTVLKSDGTDASWGTPDVQQSALLDGAVHTDTANSPVTRGALIHGNSTPAWARLAVGANGQILTTNGTDPSWGRNYGTTVYVPTPGTVNINFTSNQIIATRDVTDVAIADTMIVEGEFIILNNSGAGRVYVITVDYDDRFTIEFSTGSLAASATLMHPISFRSTCNIRSNVLAYAVNTIIGGPIAGIASSGDPTMAATGLPAISWATSTSDLSGTLTCRLYVRSADATATQQLRLVNFEVRRLTPGTPFGS